MNRGKIVFLIAVLLTIGFMAGVWVLLNPTNPFTRLFQAKITDYDAQVIVGPYPSAEDLSLLKQNKVGLIVSLLDARLPYEKVLLEQEQALAKKENLKFLNFPMSSVLGKRFGDDYNKNAKAAAEAIASEKTKTYLHCYLGVHRAKVVQDFLMTNRTTVARYKVRSSERTQEARMLDEAEAAFAAGNYAKTITILEHMPQSSGAKSMLHGWALYKSGSITGAKAQFAEAAKLDSANQEPVVGLGYCALTENDLAGAQKFFLQVPEQFRDVQWLAGWGTVLFRQNKPQEAEAIWKKVLEMDPSNKEAPDMLAAIRRALN
jgi:Flp pilus assembly protein TadD